MNLEGGYQDEKCVGRFEKIKMSSKSCRKYHVLGNIFAVVRE